MGQDFLDRQYYLLLFRGEGVFSCHNVPGNTLLQNFKTEGEKKEKRGNMKKRCK